MNWLKNHNQEVDLFRLNESPNSEQTFFLLLHFLPKSFA